MSIRAACAACATKLKIEDKMAGKSVRCPKCKAPVLVPVMEPVQAAMPEIPHISPQPLQPTAPVIMPKADEPQEGRLCQFCGESILATARKCKHCGEMLDGSKPIQTVAPNPGTAALLEVLPGLFGVFGIGHMYSGNIGLGLGMMFGYWALQALNIALLFVLVGFVTLPLTALLTLILSPIYAAKNCHR